MLKQLLKNKFNLCLLIGLYLVNLLWVWLFPQALEFTEGTDIESVILTIKPFYLGVLLLTIGNTLLAYYLSKNHSSKLWISN